MGEPAVSHLHLDNSVPGPLPLNPSNTFGGQVSPSFRNPRLRLMIGAKDTPILFFVARLVKEKDLDDLAAADVFLRRWGQKYKWVIGGDGPYRKKMEKLLPQAHFPGRSARLDVRGLGLPRQSRVYLVHEP